MNNLFLDASYVIALAISNEQNHLAASSHWQSLDRKNTRQLRWKNLKPKSKKNPVLLQG
jgi:hypothetical protein